MMTALDHGQACELASLIAALRPGWDEQGIVKQLGLARTRGTAWELAHAALHAAEDPGNLTPAIIALSGPHWTKAKAASSAVGSDNMPGAAKCPEHATRLPCPGCRADALAAEPDATTRTLVAQHVPADAIRAIRAAIENGDK
jgi:hypothetical protein